MNQKKKSANSCETCTYFTFDDELEAYVCDMDLDEDEYYRLLTDRDFSCPYWRLGDEYAVVRKQM